MSFAASAASSSCPCLTSFPTGVSPADGFQIGGEYFYYDNDYGQYEYNLNLISAQSDSIYYFYDAQLMSWNDSAYAYCDSLANSCTDQIITLQDSIWSYNESIETTMMDSVQAYHHTLFAADHNYIQYLINVNEATS